MPGAPQPPSLTLKAVSASPWGQPLLADVSIDVVAGEVIVLAGPNGTGKSSLLQLIAGDISPDTGSLQLCGEHYAALAAGVRARRLAYLPQLSLLNFPYTVEEVVLLGRTPHNSGWQEDQRILEKVLAAADITALRHRLYTQLSGGERQRTQLARVLAQLEDEGSLNGKLLLLDEPTSALDLAHQQQVLTVIRQFARRGCAVVVVIHDLNLASAIADRVLVLKSGRQVALGTPAEILTTGLIHSVFGVDVIVSQHPEAGHPLFTLRHGLT